MAIVKPKMSSGGNKFYGVCEATIIGYEDKSAKFDWADVFIEVEVRLKDSEFTKKMQICGELERTGEEVTGGSVLNRMYKFFDAIDCKAGINLKGDFEDEDGTLILNIAEYLNKDFTHKGDLCPFMCYVYKSQPKDGGQSYTRILPRLVMNTDAGKKDLVSYVAFMKQKGHLKEIDPNTVVDAEQVSLSNGAINNL